MFVDELRACEIGQYTLAQTHAFLLENENLRGVHLHGMTLKTADVNEASLTTAKTQAQTFCLHFCKYFSCRYGDKCKFVHPESIQLLIDNGTVKPTMVWKQHGKKKRGICRYFAAGKH